MNIKTMKVHVMLGVKVRHESWVKGVYLHKDSESYCIQARDHLMRFDDLNRYQPEITYTDKYVEGWELYELQNNEGAASTGNQNTP